MALKDFLFTQPDKEARLSVGTVEKKSDDTSIARNNSSMRSCSQIHHNCF